MTLLMAEPRKTGKAKVMVGGRVDPEVKSRLEEIADEITRERHPARVTAAELVAVAVEEWIERYDQEKGRTKTKGK